MDLMKGHPMFGFAMLIERRIVQGERLRCPVGRKLSGPVTGAPAHDSVREEGLGTKSEGDAEDEEQGEEEAVPGGLPGGASHGGLSAALGHGESW